MEILSLLQNRNIQTNLFIILLGISLLQLFDMKILVTGIIFILLIIKLIKLELMNAFLIRIFGYTMLITDADC